MRFPSRKNALIAPTLCLLILSATGSGCTRASFAKAVTSNHREDYSVKPRDDGGYDLVIAASVRVWLPTPEGIFPSRDRSMAISLIGPGSAESSRGFYYDADKVRHTRTPDWGSPADLGYAWVDERREHIYINFYQACPPEDIIAEPYNGKFKIPAPSDVTAE